MLLKRGLFLTCIFFFYKVSMLLLCSTLAIETTTLRPVIGNATICALEVGEDSFEASLQAMVHEMFHVLAFVCPPLYL
jgi:hypothetical protein